jgi:hypothetical protein
MFPVNTMARQKKSSQSKWVVLAGMGLNNVTIEGEKSYTVIPKNYGSSVTPVLSVGYLSPITRNFDKFFLFPHLRLFKYKNSGEEKQGIFLNTNTFQADLLVAAQLSGGMNVVNMENFKGFIAGGFGALFQIGGKQIHQIYVASDNSPYGNPKITNLSGLTYLFDASAGVAFNRKFLIEGTYMFPAPFGKYTYYTPKLSGIQIKLGYIFNK